MTQPDKKLTSIFEAFANADKKSQALLFAEINKDVEAFLSKANNDTDWKGEIFDFLSQISDSVQEQFDEHWSSDNNKKRFIKDAVKNARVAPKCKSLHSREN